MLKIDFAAVTNAVRLDTDFRQRVPQDSAGRMVEHVLSSEKRSGLWRLGESIGSSFRNVVHTLARVVKVGAGQVRAENGFRSALKDVDAKVVGLLVALQHQDAGITPGQRRAVATLGDIDQSMVPLERYKGFDRDKVFEERVAFHLWKMGPAAIRLAKENAENACNMGPVNREQQHALETVIRLADAFLDQTPADLNRVPAPGKPVSDEARRRAEKEMASILDTAIAAVPKGPPAVSELFGKLCAEAEGLLRLTPAFAGSEKVETEFVIAIVKTEIQKQLKAGRVTEDGVRTMLAALPTKDLLVLVEADQGFGGAVTVNRLVDDAFRGKQSAAKIVQATIDRAETGAKSRPDDLKAAVPRSPSAEPKTMADIVDSIESDLNRWIEFRNWSATDSKIHARLGFLTELHKRDGLTLNRARDAELRYFDKLGADQKNVDAPRETLREEIAEWKNVQKFAENAIGKKELAEFAKSNESVAEFGKLTTEKLKFKIAEHYINKKLTKEERDEFLKHAGGQKTGDYTALARKRLEGRLTPEEMSVISPRTKIERLVEKLMHESLGPDAEEIGFDSPTQNDRVRDLKSAVFRRDYGEAYQLLLRHQFDKLEMEVAATPVDAFVAAKKKDLLNEAAGLADAMKAQLSQAEAKGGIDSAGVQMVAEQETRARELAERMKKTEWPKSERQPAKDFEATLLDLANAHRKILDERAQKATQDTAASIRSLLDALSGIPSLQAVQNAVVAPEVLGTSGTSGTTAQRTAIPSQREVQEQVAKLTDDQLMALADGITSLRQSAGKTIDRDLDRRLRLIEQEVRITVARRPEAAGKQFAPILRRAITIGTDGTGKVDAKAVAELNVRVRDLIGPPPGPDGLNRSRVREYEEKRLAVVQAAMAPLVERGELDRFQAEFLASAIAKGGDAGTLPAFGKAGEAYMNNLKDDAAKVPKKDLYWPLDQTDKLAGKVGKVFMQDQERALTMVLPDGSLMVDHEKWKQQETEPDRKRKFQELAAAGYEKLVEICGGDESKATAVTLLACQSGTAPIQTAMGPFVFLGLEGSPFRLPDNTPVIVMENKDWGSQRDLTVSVRSEGEGTARKIFLRYEYKVHPLPVVNVSGEKRFVRLEEKSSYISCCYEGELMEDGGLNVTMPPTYARHLVVSEWQKEYTPPTRQSLDEPSPLCLDDLVTYGNSKGDARPANLDAVKKFKMYPTLANAEEVARRARLPTGAAAKVEALGKQVVGNAMAALGEVEQAIDRELFAGFDYYRSMSLQLIEGWPEDYLAPLDYRSLVEASEKGVAKAQAALNAYHAYVADPRNGAAMLKMRQLEAPPAAPNAVAFKKALVDLRKHPTINGVQALYKEFLAPDRKKLIERGLPAGPVGKVDSALKTGASSLDPNLLAPLEAALADSIAKDLLPGFIAAVKTG